MHGMYWCVCVCYAIIRCVSETVYTKCVRAIWGIRVACSVLAAVFHTFSHQPSYQPSHVYKICLWGRLTWWANVIIICVSIRYSITCKGIHNIIRCILQCWRFVNTRDSLKISGLMLTEYVIPAAHRGNPWYIPNHFSQNIKTCCIFPAITEWSSTTHTHTQSLAGNNKRTSMDHALGGHEVQHDRKTH